MKHNHAEMIKAWADNVELVVFIKQTSGWEVVERRTPSWHESSEHFACLPKHKKACLNSLNGGESVVTKLGNIYPTEFKNHKWDATCWYMDKECNSRIKPKKEKRWIAIDVGNEQILGDRKVTVCSHAFHSLDDARCYLGFNSVVVEIEVEVG